MPIPYCDPVLTCKESSVFESEIFSGNPALQDEAVLKAGTFAFREFALEFGNRLGCGRILVAAGSGNNGADALVFAENLARFLDKNRNFSSEITLCIPSREKLKPSAKKALERLLNSVSKLSKVYLVESEISKADGEFDLVVEGLSGMNFRPPMREDLREKIEALNSTKARLKISIDLPAGASDFARKNPVFKADATYATGIAKSPLFDPEYSEFAGRVRYVDIGFFSGGRSAESSRYCAASRCTGALNSLRKSPTNKKHYGHLFIIAGSEAYKGAALLNARAALRSGVGLVTAFVPKICASEFAAAEPSAIWIPCEMDDFGSLALENLSLFRERASQATAILAGSGVGRSKETEVFISEALKMRPDIPAVLDADAITFECIAAAERKSLLLTPHEGEFFRISQKAPPVSDEALTNASISLKAAILLKSNVERVSGGSGRIILCPGGSPALARAGSGDILAGLAGGILARKDLEASPQEAAVAAAQWLGNASRLACGKIGETALASSDIIKFLPEALEI